MEDYANKTAVDEEPQATSGDDIEAETPSGDNTKAEAASDDDTNAEDTGDEHIKASNREAPTKSPPSEKPVHRTNMFLDVVLLLMAITLLSSTISLGPYSALTMASSSLPANLPYGSAHSTFPVYMSKAPPYPRSSKKDDLMTFGPHNMMNAGYEDVWPNSHPRGGGGYIYSKEEHANHMHPIMLTHVMTTKYTSDESSHDDRHRNIREHPPPLVPLQPTRNPARHVRCLCQGQPQ